MKAPAAFREQDALLVRLCAGLLAVLAVLYGAHVGLRYFDRDEFEAVHTAWLILGGNRIYLDFFQHHHELCYHLVAAVLDLTGPRTGSLFVLRGVFAAMSLGIVWTTWALSRLVFRDTTLAWLAVVLLAGMEMFAAAAIEIRPDVPQVLCGMLSLLLILQRMYGRSAWHVLAGGLCMGVAVLLLQKAVVVAGLYGGLILTGMMMRRLKFGDLALFAAGVLIPLAIYAARLWATDEFATYLFWNWTLNLAFSCPDASLFFVWQSLAVNVVTWVLFGVGMARILMARCSVAYPLVLVAWGVLLSSGLYHLHYPQYFLHFFPVMAIIAAYGLRGVPGCRLVCALVLVASVAGGIKLGVDLVTRSNRAQLERVEYVLAHTAPEDTVYDGNVQFNLFRKDIDYFWFSVRSECSGLDAYRRLTGYEYDVAGRIRQLRPQVISTYLLDDCLGDLPEYRTRGPYPDLRWRD